MVHNPTPSSTHTTYRRPVPDCLQIPYPYKQQLLAMNALTPSVPPQLPEELLTISTPLKLASWQAQFGNYPDRQFAEFILNGIRSGFRVGFDYERSNLKSRKHNMLSALENSQVVDTYILRELTMGHTVHIPDPSILPWSHTSPFGIIPKKHKPGKWRLIVDLSAPDNRSVNDFISKDMCSLSYISVDDIAQTVIRLGEGPLLAKADIKEAYRMVPVHPDDRLLLAVEWKGQLYLDKVLPFGLRSAPIFSAIGDGIEWIVRQRGVEFVSHYADDFVVVGDALSHTCSQGLATLLQTLADLGAPVEHDKCEGPASCLTILGIEVDTIQMQLRLLQDRLARLRESLLAWRGRKCCSKRDLLSLVGSFQHAAKVVRLSVA